MSDLKKTLIEELNKYSGFRTSYDVRSVVLEALSILKSNDFKTPHKTPNSPIIKAISLKINSTQQTNVRELFVSLLCDLVSADFFGLKNVNESLQIIENVCNSIEDGVALKVLQFLASVLPSLYKDQNSVNSLFSIALSMTDNSSPSVSSAALSCCQQMVSILFKRVNSSKEVPRSVIKALNALVPEEFENPLEKIPFLLMRDISAFIYGQKPSWLRCKAVKKEEIIKLWNTVISSHSASIKGCKQILDIVDQSIQLPMLNDSFLPFYTSCVANYYDVLASTCTSVFSFLLAQCGTESNRTDSLLFFRTIYASNATFASEFFANCDQAASLTSVLIENLLKYPASISCEETVDFSLSPIKSLDAMMKSPPKNFSITAPLEIGMCICRCGNKELIGKIWQSLLSILIHSFRISSVESFPDVIKCFSDLIECMDGDESDRLAVIKLLTNVVTKHRTSNKKSLPFKGLALEKLFANKKGYFFKEKRTMTCEMLRNLFCEKYFLFKGFYRKLSNAFAVYPEVDLPIDFTKNVSVDDLKDIIDAFTQKDFYHCTQVVKIYLVNIDRFALLWNGDAVLELANTEECISVIVDFAVRISEIYNNYFHIAEIFSSLLSMQCMKDNQEERRILLSTLFTKLQAPPSPPSGAWPFVIKAFFPEDCTDAESIRIAFSGFSFIVRNLLKEVSENDFPLIIESSFGFVDQRVDINIALSALELLWIIAPRITNNDGLWISVLSRSFVYLRDERPSIATAAVDTPFSLISSNFDQMNDETFNHLLNNCFLPLIKDITVFSVEAQWPVIQKTFLNTAHCGVAFYNKFVKNESFLKEFWPLLIEKNIQFDKECHNDEVLFDSLQFFVESFACKELPIDIRTKLTLAFNEVLCWYAEHEERRSLALQCMGRVFASIIIGEKEFLTEELCDSWLFTVEKMCIHLHSEKNLHLSCLKAFEAIPKLFPVPDFVLWKICDHMSNIIANAPYETVRVGAIDLLVKILDNIEQDNIIQFCKSLSDVFQYPCSERLIESIIELSDKMTHKQAEEFFAILSDSTSSNRSPEVQKYLLDIFSHVSSDKQKEFIKCGLDLESLEILWSKYCDPSSAEFSNEISASCFDLIFDSLLGLIGELSADETKTCDLLKFISTHKVTPKKVGNNENCGTWHLIPLIPQLLRLFEDKKKKYSVEAKKILSLIRKDLDLIVK